MRPLGPDEKPSIRRLQARAAKSAIRRVQQLHDADAARKELDRIKDPVERDRRAKAHREQNAMEIKYLAKRLTDLVPTSHSAEFDDFGRIDQLRDRRYKRTSSHEYTIERLVDDASLLGVKRNRDDWEDGDSQKGDPVQEFDKNFTEAYLEHLENRYPDDDDESIVLA